MDYFIVKSLICLLLVFSDSGWASNADDRKSTTGGCFYVGANLVAWMSKRQTSVSLSTAKQNILLLEVVAHNFFG